MRIAVFLICISLFVCCLFLVIITRLILKENKRLEKESKEVEKNAERTARIITAANKTKADARTGNNTTNINYMADRLHDYANK